MATASTDHGDVGFAVVCDGVGGLSHGEVASAYVVKLFQCWFERDCGAWLESRAAGSALDARPLREAWEALLDDANAELLKRGQDAGARGGTTCTAVLTVGDFFFAGHVGDSRLYMLADGEAVQVTEDQTYVAREVARGNMTAEEAASHPRRNVILQSVGTQAKLVPAFYAGALPESACLIVCCDGLYKQNSSADIARAFGGAEEMTAQQLAGQCCELVDGAISRGETDNITIACLVRVPADPDDATAEVEFDTIVFEELDDDGQDDFPTDRLELSGAGL